MKAKIMLKQFSSLYMHIGDICRIILAFSLKDDLLEDYIKTAELGHKLHGDFLEELKKKRTLNHLTKLIEEESNKYLEDKDHG